VEAIIFCGIQATGKTTFYRDNFLKTHLRISLDLLNTRNKENLFLRLCAETGQRFVVDNTNPKKADRQRYIELARQYRFRVVGYYFRSAVEDAIRRNAQRSGKELIPVPGIRGVYKTLEIPSVDEGFDELFYVEIKDGRFHITPWQNEI
jgi:predicted kinase